MRHFPAIRHLLTHKSRVFVHSILMGIPTRGFLHDWSKLSRAEYLGIGRHFYPNNAEEKERNRELFEEAKAQHVEKNAHELEHWYKPDGTCLEIPEPVRKEIICDWAAFQGWGLTVRGVRKLAQRSYLNWAMNYRMHAETREWFERFLELNPEVEAPTPHRPEGHGSI